MAFVYLFISILCNVTGQILMKFAADELNFGGGFKLSTLVSVIANPYIAAGVVFYVLGLFTWLITLSKLELSVAYPFQALSFILVGLSSVLLFHESITIHKVIGFVLISVGILVISTSATNA
jgi:multidrug transporter EmrE-like cation transporter